MIGVVSGGDIGAVAEVPVTVAAAADVVWSSGAPGRQFGKPSAADSVAVFQRNGYALLRVRPFTSLTEILRAPSDGRKEDLAASKPKVIVKPARLCFPECNWRCFVGFVHTEVVLSNPKSDAAPLHASALVDTGALHLCLPESLARQLDLPFERFRRVTFADGRVMEAPYVGPICLQVGERECYVGAMVFGDEVLMGAIPMEDLDLLVDPARRQVVPRDPRGPVSVAKSVPG